MESYAKLGELGVIDKVNDQPGLTQGQRYDYDYDHDLGQDNEHDCDLDHLQDIDTSIGHDDEGQCRLCFGKCRLCKVSYRVGGGVEVDEGMGGIWLNIRIGQTEPLK